MNVTDSSNLEWKRGVSLMSEMKITSIAAVGDGQYDAAFAVSDGTGRSYRFIVKDANGILVVVRPIDFEFLKGVTRGVTRQTMEAILALHRATGESIEAESEIEC